MAVFAVLVATALGMMAPQEVRSQVPPQPTEEVRVEDIVVEGRRLEDAAESFVAAVADPVGSRGLARWRDGVCVGVVNLQLPLAQLIADRISTVATDIGLKAGEPGCDPNFIVIVAEDGKALAKELVAKEPRSFFLGASGTSHSRTALQQFQDVDRPVRWWQVSLPVDSETGQIATRLPGFCRDDCAGPEDYTPQVSVFAASRLTTQIRDDLQKAIVIVDIDDLGGANSDQLSDYVAMVGLAQIDPEAKTASYNSILNLFDVAANREQGLTAWDMAYLSGLYAAEPNRISRGAQIDAVASGLVGNRRGAADTGQD